jgi:hypothetical protein
MGVAARLLLALGAVCLLLGAWLGSKSLDFSSEALRATGEVVSYHEIRDVEAPSYRPRIRFTTAGGEIVTFESQLTTASKRFALGAQVPVVYPRSAPTQARLATFTDNWLGAAVALAMGLAALAGSVLIRRATRREAA